ncbi:hypothetical protein [Desertivirga xinjiangensis]|uniref:hypothetical protein n=1 Tax=Desertivirga xinjiangensis TaxID=539206 RepID=UPI002108FC11|nr:hypothetical protein [Pedobacter xinjiangensis]
MEKPQMKEKANYQWQGEPVSVRFGYAYQEENPEKPLFWYNFECHNEEKLDGSYEDRKSHAINGKYFALIPAVEVTTSTGYKFLLSNHCGIGVNKLLKGGWPNATHFSLTGDFKESEEPYFKFTAFDLDAYEKHESARRTWQKKLTFYRSETAKIRDYVFDDKNKVGKPCQSIFEAITDKIDSLKAQIERLKASPSNTEEGEKQSRQELVEKFKSWCDEQGQDFKMAASLLMFLDWEGYTITKK